MENLYLLISKKVTPIYLFLLGIIVILFFILFNTYNGNEKVKYLQKKIEDLQVTVDDAYKNNRKLQNKIEGFNDSISKIDKAINDNNKKIDKLKEDEKNKLDNFKSYDAGMWERYFAERYKDKK